MFCMKSKELPSQNFINPGYPQEILSWQRTRRHEFDKILNTKFSVYKMHF